MSFLSDAELDALVSKNGDLILNILLQQLVLSVRDLGESLHEVAEAMHHLEPADSRALADRHDG